MRNTILFLSGGAALFLFACLVAPDEPSKTSSSALSCGTDERAFNGSCRKVCTASATCPSGTTCMNVGTGVALCLEYQHCAHLSSDTTCAGANVGYSSYSSYGGGSDAGVGDYWGYGGYYGDYGYGSYSYPAYGYASSFYGYGGAASAAGCAGDAKWTATLPTASSDPKCGEQHTVTRCAPVGAGQCGLVSGTTVDVADP